MTNSRPPHQAKGGGVPSVDVRASVSISRSEALLNGMESNSDAQQGPLNQQAGRENGAGSTAMDPWSASQRGTVACPELLNAINQEGLSLAKNNKD